jgi:hypothetical protein
MPGVYPDKYILGIISKGLGTSWSFGERQFFYCAGKNAFGFLPLNLSAKESLSRAKVVLYNILFKRKIYTYKSSFYYLRI